MAHARAWVALRYPGALSLEAYAKIVWIPTSKERLRRSHSHTRVRLTKEMERVPISLQEDLFGCFDLIVFPTDAHYLLDLVQVTTMHADGTDQHGTVATRKKKIEVWAKVMLDATPAWLGQITLLGWVPRKHFRVWTHDPRTGWTERPPETAPLPRKKRAKAAASPPPLP